MNNNFSLGEKIWWKGDLSRQIFQESGTISGTIQYIDYKSISVLWNASCGSRDYRLETISANIYLSFGDPVYV